MPVLDAKPWAALFPGPADDKHTPSRQWWDGSEITWTSNPSRPSVSGTVTGWTLVTTAKHLLISEPIPTAWGQAQVRDGCLPLQLVTQQGWVSPTCPMTWARQGREENEAIFTKQRTLKT